MFSIEKYIHVNKNNNLKVSPKYPEQKQMFN